MNSNLQEMISDCDKEISEIEEIINELGPFDRKRVYLTNYALFRVCSSVDTVFRYIIADYFSSLGSSKINNYFDMTIRNSTSTANFEDMIDLLNQFDINWSNQFKCEVESCPNCLRIKAAADSLANNRKLFMRTGHINTTITIREIKCYYLDVKELLNLFDSVINCANQGE